MRNLQLDLLRALAITLVLGRHMSQTPPDMPQFIKVPFEAWRHIGWMGVDLFFVLSGFLISGLIIKEFEKHGDFNGVHFLIRRGFKIYPSYYLFLVLSLPAIIWIPNQVTPYSFMCEALFVSNYFANIWGQTWSLCIEEHFYILFALGFFILSKRKAPIKYLMWACIVTLIFPLAGRIYISSILPFYQKPFQTATMFRIDALAFGVLISCLFQLYGDRLKDKLRKFAPIITICGALMILPTAIWGYEKQILYTAGLTALYMGWGLILAVAMCYEFQSKNKIITTIALVGTFSYSIYLWHKPFSGLCQLPTAWWPGHLNEWGRLAVFFIASFAVGIGMSKLIEYPTLKLRDKWFPSRSA